MMTLKMAFWKSTLFCTYKISDNWTDIVSIDIHSLSCTGCSLGIYICCPIKKIGWNLLTPESGMESRKIYTDTKTWNH